MRFPTLFAALLVGLSPLALAVPATAQVAAATADAGDPAAQAFVEKLASDAFGVLRDKSLSKPAARAKFRTMLQQNVALEDIGNRLIRRQRATITPAQYVAYQQALPEFVLNAYADRLYDYSDATIKTLRTVGRGPMTDVFTRVTRPGSQPVDAIWQVKKNTAGKMVVNNLSVQGINLSLTQEADFNAYIQKNGFDALVTFLKTANSEIDRREDDKLTSRLDIAATAFIHPSAQLFGHVSVGEGASVWCNAVVRCETSHVAIGNGTNVQDFVMIHTGPGTPVTIGDYSSITHHATLHCCTIGDHVLVGINATIYDGAVIGSGSIVGQHAYVKNGTIVPPNSIVVGSPATVIRTKDNRLANRINAEFYIRNAAAYARGEHRAWDGPEFETWFGDMMKTLAAEYA